MKLLTVLAILLLSFQVFGWSDVGHLLIGRIAELQLTKNKPEIYTNFSSIISAFNQLSDGRSSNFVQSTLWADDIKDYKADLFNQYHFVNRVYDPDNILPFLSMKYKDINVVNTIGWAMSILKKNKSFISFDRAFMARFLMNLVGQIHQPLNTIVLFNSTKALQKGDQGGKLINMTTSDNINMTLSKFIDLGATLIQKPNATYSRPLNSSIVQIIDNLSNDIVKSYSYQSFGNATSNLSPQSWGVQSYNLAISDIYPYVKGTNKITEQWTTKMYELSKKQIALAGYRLANMIVSIY